MSNECPTDELLERYHNGQVTGDAAETLRAHLAECDRCRRRSQAEQETLNLLDDLRVVIGRGESEAGAQATALLEQRHARGATIGPYEIQDLLGVGGMARVYRAVHKETGKIVALKVLKDEQYASEEIRARFMREAQAMGQFRHPNVVRVYPPEGDTPVTGFAGLAMELLTGGTLGGWIRRQRDGGTTPDPAEALNYALQTARGLGAAHAQGLVHRDIKPSNLLLDDQGHVKVSDFGVVQALESTTWVTGTGQHIGTPAYMSPEQCRGERATPASDVYSLGVTMFELATGRLPFVVEGGSPFAQMLKHISEPAPDPARFNSQVPDRFAAVILRCLCKSPQERFPNGDALSVALERASRPEPEPDTSTPSSTKKSPWQINAPIIREQLQELPQRSIVAWACRCARGVQCFNDDPRVEQAIAMAEAVAGAVDEANDSPASSRILIRMQRLRAASLGAAYADGDTAEAPVAAARAAAATSASASARCVADAAADAVFALENALLACRASGRSASAFWRQAQRDFRILRAAGLGAPGTVGQPVPTTIWEGQL